MEQQYLSTERQSDSTHPKKKFLARGTGTAGGRKGYENKFQSRQAKPSDQNEGRGRDVTKSVNKRMLSEGEDTETNNFGSEQDTKSPRISKNGFNSRP